MLPLPSPQRGASPDIPYHQFRTLVAAPRSARAIAIGSRPSPLGLVLGQIQCGPGRTGASERFQLILQLCGEGDGAEGLQV
jgi:hypothetical protein